MSAATAERLATPIAPGEWVTVRCSNRACREVLFRYQSPPGATDTLYTKVQTVCPDRRCRKAQEVRLPAGVVPVTDRAA